MLARRRPSGGGNGEANIESMVKNMNNRERVINSLNHKQPDKTPYNVSFRQKSHDAMVKFYNDSNFASKLGNCFTHLDCIPKDCLKEISPNIWQDHFGVQWNRTYDKDIGVVCNRVVNSDNVNEYIFPNPDDPVWYETWNERIKSNPDGFFIGKISFSLFERAWAMTGMENLLMAMIMEKEFVHTLFDRILEYNLKIINNALSYNVDGMQFGDDWGQQTGLLMGPALWRGFIKPRVTQMYQNIRKKNKWVFIHSCGKVQELFPELIECGLNVFNPFQPEVMDVNEMKEKYGDSLSFYGGISTQNTLPYGTPVQVKEEVHCLIEKVGKNGGYFASPAHSIPADAKPENIAAMIEVLKNQ